MLTGALVLWGWSADDEYPQKLHAQQLGGDTPARGDAVYLGRRGTFVVTDRAAEPLAAVCGRGAGGDRGPDRRAQVESAISTIGSGASIRTFFTLSWAATGCRPNAAFSFLLIGLALVLMDVRVRGRAYLPQTCVLAATAIGLLSMSSYFHNVLLLYGIAGYVPVVPDTATEFLILCAGLLCARLAPRAGRHHNQHYGGRLGGAPPLAGRLLPFPSCST